MNKVKKAFNSLTKIELIIWLTSISIIFFSSLIFGNFDFLNVLSSVMGVTGIIFIAKGLVIGQLFVILFCLTYSAASYSFGYYGELITTLGMTMPMAILSTIVWLKNPYKDSDEVEVSKMTTKKWVILLLILPPVSFVCYQILKYFNTPNLIVSTMSVVTSFSAVTLTSFRSEYFAIAYSFNDIVLIILWGLASYSNPQYVSIVICFITFFINDIYAFYNWSKIKKRQNNFV